MTWSSVSRSGTASFATCAVARADRFGLRAPGGDAGGVLRMSRKPRLDGLDAVRRQFAVDIGVQFVFGHG